MYQPQTNKFIRNLSSCILSLLTCVSLITVGAAAQSKNLSGQTADQSSNNLLAPAPIFVDGNPNCSTLNASSNSSFAHITSNYELKLDSPLQPFNGTYQFVDNPPNQFFTGNANSSNTVTTSTSGNNLTFTSTIGVAAVIVKGGPNANVYVYPQGSFGDNGLTTPGGAFGISHISFCYYMPAQITIIKEVETFNGGNASTQAFPFTATNFGTANFSLVDNNAQPADRITNSAVYSFGAANAVTITESLTQNWSLADISCVETAGAGLPNLQNTTINFGARTANIVVEQGEKITCTFKNLQVIPTAATASIGGRVLTETGLPLRRAAVTVFNANTLETRTVYTNSLGYYRVDGLTVNDFYIVTVAHGKRAFQSSTQSFTLEDNLTDLNFVAVY